MSSQVVKYLSYKSKANSKHKVHSPFVFEIIVDVFEDKNQYYAYPAIELVRSKMLLSDKTIEIKDLGAGSRVFKSNRRKIKDIAKHSAKSEKYAQLLFRLVNYFQPKTIIELGTSLGLTTSYLSKARKLGAIYSLEGSPEICNQAQANFKSLLVENVQLKQGDFNETLPAVLDKIETVDFVFFDGNHQRDPTLDYFKQCLAKKTDTSVFIFDDIHWSDEMTKAWEEIKQHPEVTLTIDIFQFGMVFFKKGVEKQHFVLKF